MQLKLPNTFRFSPITTFFALALALLMICASIWQWKRYHFKQWLVSTYQANSYTTALEFPSSGKTTDEFKSFLHHKVKVNGKYDFEHQFIILNQRHKTGPGYWLMTPLKIENSSSYVIVSRGFIPFEDSTPDSWKKYNEPADVTLEAVIQSTVSHSTLFMPDSAGSKAVWIDKWFYPDIEKISQQLPYPIITPIYLQKLGGPSHGIFPAQSVSIEVPPSTHFWYSIEWILLAISSLLIAFLLQAFPRPAKRFLTTPLILLLTITLPTSVASAITDPSVVENEAGIIEHLGNKINSELLFTDQNGQAVTIDSLHLPNRPYIITPVYYGCPRLCTLTLNGVSKLINKLDLTLGKDYHIISVSIDETETPELASRKAEAYYSTLTKPLPKISDNQPENHDWAKQGWHFLTGTKNSISELTDQLGFKFGREGSEIMHAAGFMVISPSGTITRYFYGIDYNPKDVRFALVDAAKGKIGSTLDRVLLFCFHFDPTSGKYTLAIWNVIRAVSLAILLAVLASVVYLRLSE